MRTLRLPILPACDSDFDVDKIVERYYPYIIVLSCKKALREVAHSELLVDELVQSVRIKLWSVLRKKHIQNPKAYIRCLVFTEVINMVRSYRSTLPLPLDEDGDLYQGSLVSAPSERMRNSASALEREEARQDNTGQIVGAILKHPRCQQHAMIYSLSELAHRDIVASPFFNMFSKHQFDDVLLMIQLLRVSAIEVEEINWLEEKHKPQGLQASLSIARKKLRFVRNLALLNTKDKHRHKSKLNSSVGLVYPRSISGYTIGRTTHLKGAFFCLYDVRGSPRKANLEYLAMKVSR